MHPRTLVVILLAGVLAGPPLGYIVGYTPLGGTVDEMHQKLTDLDRRLTAKDALIEDLQGRLTQFEEERVGGASEILSLRSELNSSLLEMARTEERTLDLSARLTEAEDRIRSLDYELTGTEAIVKRQGLEVSRLLAELALRDEAIRVAVSWEVPEYRIGFRFRSEVFSRDVISIEEAVIVGEEELEGESHYVVRYSYSPPLAGIYHNGTAWISKMTLDLSRSVFHGYLAGSYVRLENTVSIEYLEGSRWPLRIGNSWVEVRTINTTAYIQLPDANSRTSTVINTIRVRVTVEALEKLAVKDVEYWAMRLVERDAEEEVVNVSWYSDRVGGIVKYQGGERSTQLLDRTGS